MVGLICLAAGVARLGFVADLLSKPVRVGYLAGLAVTIVVGQLPKLLGISIDADGFLREVGAIVANLGQTNPWTLAAGLLTLAIILGARRWALRAPGVLVAVLAAIAATVLLDLAARGVATVGVPPQGFPAAELPSVELADLPLLAGDGAGHGAGGHRRHHLDLGRVRRPPAPPGGRQSGVGRHRGGQRAGRLFQGFPVSTSGSRTAVAEQSGAQTQLTGVVAAGAVLAMLLFVPGLVQNLPQAALAAIIIAAGSSLFDLAALRRLLAVRPGEFRLAVACALGVILLGVLQGIVLAVLLSIVQVFARGLAPTRPCGEPEDARLPRPHPLSGGAARRRPADDPLGRAALLRQRQHLPHARPRASRAVGATAGLVVVAAEPITDLDRRPPTCSRSWTWS